ncbi:hypothetical protein, partial [Actinoplanes sp. NBRC 103695]|uniref:hypothetical protein n=1 Tax=Actinoplanes sp. NBRC 103695 TaxID=3032202 RepID=UPI0025555BB5
HIGQTTSANDNPPRVLAPGTGPLVLRAGVDPAMVGELLIRLRAVALEYGSQVREALAPHAGERAYVEAMRAWNSFTALVASFAGP